MIKEDVAERKTREIGEKDKLVLALQESVTRYGELFSRACEGICILTVHGDLVDVNESFAAMHGYTVPAMRHMSLKDLDSPASYQLLSERMDRLLAGEALHFEVEHFAKDGHVVPLEVSANLITLNNISLIQCFHHDLSRRKEAEEYGIMRQEMLAILNEPEDSPDSIQRVLAALKVRTGCSAVAIRLQEGEDFPYYGQDGFSADFLRTENTLISHDADGLMCRDKDGNVRLVCTCGLVIEGRTDPSSPFFTPGGSFWTNDSFQLGDLPSDADPRHNPRNQCMHDGYASFALVPLRNKDRIIGLIQFNDLRKGHFTLAAVEHLERIATHIGEALMRRRAEEVLRVSHERYDRLALQTGSFAWEADADGLYTYANSSCESVLGYRPDELVGRKHFYDLHPEAGRQEFKQTALAAFDQQAAFKDLENAAETKDGHQIWLSTTGLPHLNADGSLRGYRGIDRDISRRKQIEYALEIQNRTLSQVLNSLDSLVYVADIKTYEIVFINTYGQNIWGDVIGKICWQTLQGAQAGPCKFCTNSKLIKPDGNPTEGVIWEFQNTITKRWYDCRDRAIYWPDGRIVRLEIASDITERKQTE